MRIRPDHPDSNSRLHQPVDLRLARRVDRRQREALVNLAADQGGHRPLVGQKEGVAAGLREKAYARIALSDVRLKIERQRRATRVRIAFADRLMSGCGSGWASWSDGNAGGQDYCGRAPL
jgi:hypothetical protein